MFTLEPEQHVTETTYRITTALVISFLSGLFGNVHFTLDISVLPACSCNSRHLDFPIFQLTGQSNHHQTNSETRTTFARQLTPPLSQRCSTHAFCAARTCLPTRTSLSTVTTSKALATARPTRVWSEKMKTILSRSQEHAHEGKTYRG
jgi:hypothetical protein